MMKRGLSSFVVGCLVTSTASISDAQTAPPPEPAPSTAPEPPAVTSPPALTWYDAVALDAFIDAYGSINYNFPRPQTLTGGFGGNQFRAFDTTNGFAIGWAGVNASVAPDPVGGAVSLRFGPTAALYAGNDTAYGLEYVKQAFASWKPGGKESPVTIDFGKYDQPYGSEVAETQFNMNYSRSALFTYAQPLFFTGVRVDYAATSRLDLKLVLANGWNNSVSANAGKTAGLQVNFKPSDASLISVGYATGPQQTEAVVGPLPLGANAPAGTTPAIAVTSNSDASTNLRHMVDAIVDVTVADKVRFLLNGDFVTESTAGASVKWYGVNLGVRYAATDSFGVAVRGEYLGDPDGFGTGTGKKGTTLVDGTLTLDGKITEHLVVKLEQRLDALSDEEGDALFQSKTRGTSKTQMTTMLGVVAKTN